MTQLLLAANALRDIERLTDFLLEDEPELAAETGELLMSGLALLRSHPLIGRKVEHGLREVVISRGRSGYLALYRYHAPRDLALVLALRHQRETDHALDDPFA